MNFTDYQETDPIWLLSTKGRPQACQRVVESCYETYMTSRGIVYVDETVDDYQDLDLPDNWSIHYEPEWGGLQSSLQWCYNQFPEAACYGWLADDTYPRTDFWDRELEKSAGDWKLSYAKDLWHVDDEDLAEKCYDLTAGLCWGGKLVRAVGWWALPDVMQAGIDTAWTDICRTLGLHAYRGDVIVEHCNWRTGKRLWDETDNWERGLDNFIQQDLDRKLAWETDGGLLEVLRRVYDQCPVTNQGSPGLPAARNNFSS